MTGNGGMENGSAWPRPRFGSLDVLADVPHELSAQIGGGGEDATGDDVALDPGEPQFDLVEPGRVSRREVQPDTIERRRWERCGRYKWRRVAVRLHWLSARCLSRRRARCGSVSRPAGCVTVTVLPWKVSGPAFPSPGFRVTRLPVPSMQSVTASSVGPPGSGSVWAGLEG